MAKPAEVAAAFSTHRFSDAYDALAKDVRWVAIGGSTIVGRSAVIDICEATTRELADDDLREELVNLARSQTGERGLPGATFRDY
jgi:hypothetical protein